MLYSCTHMATVGVKGLRTRQRPREQLAINPVGTLLNVGGGRGWASEVVPVNKEAA